MRYTTAATVAALATGAIAAGHGHAAHHHHHEREANAAAEAEPEPTNYTYSDGQCWGTFGCDAKTGAPAAATSAPAQATVSAAAVTHAAATKASSASAGNVVQSMASKATSAAGSVASNVSNGVVNVESMISAVQGMLAVKSDGSVAEDSSKANVVNVSNESGKNLAFVCWGAAGSWVNRVAPILALGMAPNDKKTISFDGTPSGQQGGGCSVIYESGSSLNQGQIFDTWLEWTFNQWGVVDVSREPNMNGPTSLSASCPSGCTTSMDKCVYKCIDGTSRCGAAGTYQNMDCSGTGANPSPTDGGCMIGSGGSIDVTIS